MKSLDTNIALRLLLQDVPGQFSKIVALIDASKPSSLAVADAVFFECAWALGGDMYKFDRELIGKLLLQLAYIPQINCNQIMLEKAVPLFVNNNQISFIDACLVIYAELNDAAPLLTFDQKLAKQLPNYVQLI